MHTKLCLPAAKTYQEEEEEEGTRMVGQMNIGKVKMQSKFNISIQKNRKYNQRVIKLKKI